MREHLWGNRKGPAMVGRDQLTALVLQLRLDGRLAAEHWGSSHRKSAAANIEKARYEWRISQSPRGDWLIKACVMAEILSDTPVRWTSATNGGAWKHAAAGWWRSKTEAEAALEAAIREVYSDEFAALAAAEAIRQAGLDALALYNDRLQAIKARAEVVGWSSWFFDAWGWSSGGGRKPYTEEAITAFEAEVLAVEQRRQEQVVFLTGVPPLFARLVTLDVKTELDYSGNVRLIEGDHWVTPFPMTVAGLAELEAYVADQERRHTVPVVAKSLNLTGLFGGAAVVKKK